MSDNISGNNTSNNNSYMTILREENRGNKINIVNTNNNLNPDRRTHKSRSSTKIDYTQSGGNLPEGIGNVLRKDFPQED